MENPPHDRDAQRRALRRTLRALLWRARPWLAAAAAAFAVVILAQLAFPAPAATTPVLLATTDLSAGHTVTAADVRSGEWPDDLAPPSALAAGDAIGQVLAAPVPEGAALTARHLTSGGWIVAEGEVAVPVRFADPAAASILPDGATLTLIKATGDGAVILTDRARVLATRADPTSSGLLSSADGSDSALVMLALPETTATSVVDASAAGTLWLALGAAERDP